MTPRAAQIVRPSVIRVTRLCGNKSHNAQQTVLGGSCDHPCGACENENPEATSQEYQTDGRCGIQALLVVLSSPTHGTDRTHNVSKRQSPKDRDIKTESPNGCATVHKYSTPGSRLAENVLFPACLWGSHVARRRDVGRLIVPPTSTEKTYSSLLLGLV